MGGLLQYNKIFSLVCLTTLGTLINFDCRLIKLSV